MRWKLALGDPHTDTWLSKLVSNKQGAVKSEGMSSHTALAEVVPLARGFWRIMTGCILVIGLEALRGADKSISPFLKSDTVETRQCVIMLPIFHPSQTCSHLMKLLDPMLFLRQQWAWMRYPLVLVFGTADVSLVLLHRVQFNIAHGARIALQCGGWWRHVTFQHQFRDVKCKVCNKHV